MIYTAGDERKLRRMVKNLDRIAKELTDMNVLIMVTTVRRPRTMLPLSEMGRRISSISNQIRKAVRNPKWREFKTLTSSHRLPYFVEQVKRITGKPHYSDLAILIGAAYRELDFSEDDLKGYVRRAQSRRKSSPGNSNQPQIDKSEK
jgi:hypothetical protein